MFPTRACDLRPKNTHAILSLGLRPLRQVQGAIAKDRWKETEPTTLNGNITVTYVEQDSAPNDVIHFVMCKPSGAPKQPVCSAALVVANESRALGPGIFGALSGLTLPIFTAARHSNRLETDGHTITTFVVWDRCRTLFTSNPGSYTTCLNAQVVMSASKDGGNTWSAPVPVSKSAGLQFFPWIATDDSTGTVNIVYYDTALDMFHQRTALSLSQIARGSTAIGTPIAVTTSPEPWDADPTQNPLAIGFELHLGMKARGMGTTGFSRVYTSFTSTADRRALYSGSLLLSRTTICRG